jgi:abhydrolase domain-containing protein 6
MQAQLNTSGILIKFSIGAVILLMLVSSQALVGCSKREVFAMLMEHERNKAKLVVNTQNLSYGKITYLANTSRKSETSIVMLHGFGGDKDNWDRFSQKLTNDYHLIIPDLPGHGESVQDVSLNYGIEEQTKRLKEFLDALGIKKAHIVGNSMGGAIAMRYAFLYPQAVLSLTLIDSAGAVKTPSEFDASMKTTNKNPMLEIKNAQDFKNVMTKYVFVDPPYVPGFVIDVLLAEKIKRKTIEQKIFRDILVDLNQMSTLSTIHSPTLIIWGAQDKVIHVDNAEFLHQKIPGSQKEVIEAVGHCPMIEKPEVTTELYRKFMHGIGGV